MKEIRKWCGMNEPKIVEPEKTEYVYGTIYVPMRLRHPHQSLGNHAIRVTPIRSGEWAAYGESHG